MDRLPLTDIPVGRIPPSILVCGDPGRAEQIATFFDSAEAVSSKREYTCIAGQYEGLRLAVCSHGIGASGAAIAFEELIAAGAKRIIRVGTCGALQREIEVGDLIIAHAAVQNTGYGNETVPLGYPAVADPEVTLALKRAAVDADRPCRIGIVLSRDNFYRGVDVPGGPDYQIMSLANVLAVEMECSALFIVGNLRGIQTGAIVAVDGNVLVSGGEKMEKYAPGTAAAKRGVENGIKIALHSLRRMQLETG